MNSYTVRVTKDYLTFCAAHFIVFNNDQCERLHGHNYRVAAELENDLGPDHLVFDFIALKQILREITNELDHRMLVPLKSDKLSIDAGDKVVRLSAEDTEWILPRGDCVLLPLENTTAELLARWLATRLEEEVEKRFGAVPRRLRLEVEESPGQSAFYERVVDDPEAASGTGR